MSLVEILLIIFVITFFITNIICILCFESKIKLRKSLEGIEIKKHQAISNKKHLKLIDKFTRKNT